MPLHDPNLGGPHPEQPPLHIGERIADTYVVQRLVGQGGMGQVWLAHDVQLDRPVALKLLTGPAGDRTAVSRFQREARVLSRIVHPHVVAVYGSGRVAQGPFLVMEFVDGRSLEQLLAESGPLPVDDALAICRQVAAGLAAAHGFGVVHRDVKPSNILVRRLATGGWLAKVVDFGLARDLVDPGVLTQGAGILGTPAYMSPEQVRGDELDGRSDLYALAVVVYRLLTGHLPYRAQGVSQMLHAHLTAPPVPLSSFAPSWPVGLERALQSGLAKQPHDRPATVVAFAAALQEAAGVVLPADDATLAGCADCGAGGQRTGAWCQACGGWVPRRVCRACGAPQQGVRAFCRTCQASLLPPTRPLPGGPSGHPGLERRTAVAFVALWDELPAEDEEALHQALLVAVEREGGRPLALAGRQWLAVFGLAGMREREVAAAVDAALALQRWQPAHGQATPRLRIGIELGPVESAGMGVCHGAAWAGGAAVDRARVVADEAAEPGVRLGAAAWAEVGDAFDAAALPSGTRAIRGRAAVLERQDAAAGLVLPLVGRDLELGRLLLAARTVVQRRRMLVVPLIGAAGTGKSRLLAAFLHRLDEVAAHWHVDQARCTATATTAYEPFAEILQRRLAGPLPAAAADSETAPAQRTPQEHARRRQQALRDLLALPGSSHGDGRPRENADREAAFEAVASYVERAASRGPVVLAIDDLHAARPSTLELLAWLVRRAEDLPVLLVLAARTEAQDGVFPELRLPTARTAAMALEPLSDEECQDLLAAWWQGPLPAGLADAVRAFSGGVPGRIAEAAEALLQRGAVHLTPAGPRLAPAVSPESALDRSLDAWLAQRAGRLPPAERDVLVALAIAGEPMPAATLAAIVDRADLQADLASLREAGYLAPDGPAGTLQLRSAALGAALVEATSVAARRALHVRAARRLLAMPGARQPADVTRIARHLVEAGEPAQALPHLLETAAHALRAFANREAWETLRMAAHLADAARQQAAGDPTLGELWAQAQVGVAEVGARVGELDAASRAAAALLEAQPPVGAALRLRARVVLADLLEMQGAYDQAAADLALASREVADEPELQARACHATARQAMVLWKGQRAAEAEALARDGLRRWPDEPDRAEPDRAELQAGRGRLLSVLGHVASHRQAVAEAAEHYAGARRAFEEAGDALAVAMTVLSLGNLAYRAADPVAAEVRWREAAVASRGLDDLHGAALAETNLGTLLLEQAQPAAALDCLQRAEQAKRRLGRRDTLPETLRLRAWAHLRLGERQQARQVALEAVALARTVRHAEFEAGALAVLEAVDRAEALLAADTLY